jgi:hypothetical protein
MVMQKCLKRSPRAQHRCMWLFFFLRSPKYSIGPCAKYRSIFAFKLSHKILHRFFLPYHHHPLLSVSHHHPPLWPFPPRIFSLSIASKCVDATPARGAIFWCRCDYHNTNALPMTLLFLTRHSWFCVSICVFQCVSLPYFSFYSLLCGNSLF